MTGISAKVVGRLVRIGSLHEPMPGVLVVSGSTPSWMQQLSVACLGSRGAATIAFSSAAALHRFDGYLQGPVEVLVPSWRAQLTAVAKVHVGDVDPRDVTSVEQVRCTGVARTLVDIAAADDPDRVEIAFESVRRRGTSLRWIEATAERLRHRGRAGPRLILSLVAEAKGQRPAESALEVRLARILKHIPGLERQHVVTSSSGAFVARTDFAIPLAKIAIEAHSREFHTASRAIERDERREQSLRLEGWDVHYFTWEAMQSPELVRRQIEIAVRRACPT